MREPEVGQDAYVPTEVFLTHGRDDFAGGLCRVIRVTDEALAGENAPFVEFAERPGYLYNWSWLMEQQEQLRKQFGSQRGHANPDLRPEFNEE